MYLVSGDGVTIFGSDNLVSYLDVSDYLEADQGFILGNNNLALSHSTININNGTDDRSWKIFLRSSTRAFTAQVRDFGKFLIVAVIILFAGAIIFGYFFSRSLTNSISVLKNAMITLGKGEHPKEINFNNKDELFDMAAALNSYVNSLKSILNFAEEIGQGNLEADYETLGGNDQLGQALIGMRNNLRSIVTETNEVVSLAGAHGDLSARIDISDKQGAWKNLCQSTNDLLKSISSPLNAVNNIVNAIAKGDLTKKEEVLCYGDMKLLVDNLGQANTNLNSLLRQIIESASIVDQSSKDMQVASGEMNNTSNEITSAIGEMSQGAQTQVSKVEESSNLMEGILKSSDEMRDMAETINQAAKSGASNSQRGKNMVENVAACMNEISEGSNKTNSSIKVLTERSSEISRVTKVIGDIASQTNLLALNAAIEAAQAGDAGRGFAVVAEEIRKLAEDSRKSAKEIEELIGNIQQDTQIAAGLMESMNSNVLNGVEASNEVSNVFEDISQSKQPDSTTLRKHSESDFHSIKRYRKCGYTDGKCGSDRGTNCSWKRGNRQLNCRAICRDE